MSDSKTPGHIALNGREYVIQEETYQQQLQTPFNPRFSTGDQGFGDLSFYQYLAQVDWSGGSGQLVFDVTNQFLDSEGVDITLSNGPDVHNNGGIKLAPKVEYVMAVNGPQAEQFNRPVEQEDAWPQIIEWLGRAIIFNDRIEHDAGGVDFLDVFDTDITQDHIINTDNSNTAGVITNDTSGGTSLGSASQKTRAEILEISKPQGLPGDLINVKVQFTNIQLDFMSSEWGRLLPDCPKATPSFNVPIRFRIDFGGTAERQSATFAYQDIFYDRASTQWEFIPNAAGLGVQPGGANEVLLNQPYNFRFVLARPVIVNFTVRVPNVASGLYKLWTSASFIGAPFQAYNLLGQTTNTRLKPTQDIDPNCNANVLFFVQGIDAVTVTRKNLYAPQLKAATVSGSQLVGMRTIDGAGYVEVYTSQNAGVDRTLQMKLSDVSSTISNPTYCELLASSNGVIVAAFDNRVYKIDILTSGLTTAQRFVFIGIVPGTYVSGMALWNQRVYGGSFDKTNFRSTIWWTDLTAIQGSYAIDGKFWITDMANFQGGLFYSGGKFDGTGEIRAFPAKPVISVSHPALDSRVRSLNAGRLLYGGWSHGTGLIVVDDVPGASTWSRIDLGDSINNVVWDIEEVGDNVYFLAGNGLYKTTGNFMSDGWLESSEYGGNTPLIDKLFVSVIIEARNVTGAHTIRVLATHADMPEGQWVVLGTMTNADDSQKEFLLPNDFQSQWMRVRIEIHTEDQSESPIIKKVLIKYVPTVIQKWQWVVGIRATDNLKMLDQQFDKRSGSQIISDLQSLKSFGIIKFRDVDENEYNAILTDLRISPPLLDKRNREAIVFLELLEA